ncbi:hypothetical protein SNOG_14592 [Parastagonospora nodorum SN15]|uniref:Uncharacterized protein n=1 Tax=Phaeosphaeria nodorum (strain SN15 / ATCC MYA-4574 / FGSC 10173) TaxID=321614 RepID=Q0U175_PHANO|nr:hypothetical protein SNOG_14592 [Parastagonospora nodorum SN15]EAT78132.1 hypothetical protein SNOG_14592 [Parastagonospora nodorum SN15]
MSHRIDMTSPDSLARSSDTRPATVLVSDTDVTPRNALLGIKQRSQVPMQQFRYPFPRNT